jgi:hypothetical protein
MGDPEPAVESLSEAGNTNAQLVVPNHLAPSQSEIGEKRCDDRDARFRPPVLTDRVQKSSSNKALRKTFSKYSNS